MGINRTLRASKTHYYYIFLPVIIVPSAPDNTYIVEVQRGLSITCFGSNPDDIVAWIRKLKRILHHRKVTHILCITSAEGAAVGGLDTNVNTSDLFCPTPEPFIRNTESDIAVLMSDGFNGTQPIHAGNYTCYSNGLPRATVEVVVLGK